MPKVMAVLNVHVQTELTEQQIRERIEQSLEQLRQSISQAIGYRVTISVPMCFEERHEGKSV